MNLDKTKYNFTPVFDRVVIHPEESEKITKGGIIVDYIKTTTNKGFVVSVGEKATSVKAGDYVYYDAARCASVEMNGVLFHIARDTPEGQIEMILEEGV